MTRSFKSLSDNVHWTSGCIHQICDPGDRCKIHESINSTSPVSAGLMNAYTAPIRGLVGCCSCRLSYGAVFMFGLRMFFGVMWTSSRTISTTLTGAVIEHDAAYLVGLSVFIVHKQQSAVLDMLFFVLVLPQLAAAVEVPHLQLTSVATCQHSVTNLSNRQCCC